MSEEERASEETDVKTRADQEEVKRAADEAWQAWRDLVTARMQEAVKDIPLPPGYGRIGGFAISWGDEAERTILLREGNQLYRDLATRSIELAEKAQEQYERLATQAVAAAERSAKALEMIARGLQS